MSEIFEIERAIKVLENGGVSKSDLTILHCNTEYPTPLEDVNLNVMATLAEKFGINVGYSDHTLGIEVPIAAVAMGATVIEKHFTLDKSLEGPDHVASLSPLELSLMVKGIRNIEKALGSSEKKTTMSEMKNRDIARRSIHVKNDLKQGTVISSKDLVMKRPGNGISPFEADKIIGKILARDVIKDEILKLTDIV
jgi:sialic acid synthase SpsE